MHSRAQQVTFALGLMGLCGISTAAAHLVPIHQVRAAAGTSAAEAPAQPQRIVSVISTADEVLMDLGLGARLVGLSALADDPIASNIRARARHVPHRGRALAEELIPIAPDLIFVSPFNRPETLALLAHARIPTQMVPPASSLAEIRNNIQAIGEAVGNPSGAAALVRQMDQGLAFVRQQVPETTRPRVLFFEASGRTAGVGTTIDELIALAGGRNVAAEEGLQGNAALSIERVLAMDPEMILVLDYRADGRARSPLGWGDPSQGLQNSRSVWRHARAVQNGQVHRLNPSTVLSTSHYIAEAALEIAQALHPGAFGSEESRDE